MIYFGWKNNAGLICLTYKQWHLHFFIRKAHWFWGKEDEEYDCILTYYGLGPLLLLVRNNCYGQYD